MPRTAAGIMNHGPLLPETTLIMNSHAAHRGGGRAVRTQAGARLLDGPHQFQPLVAEVAGGVQLVGGAAAVGRVHGVLDDGPGPARERDHEPRLAARGRVDSQQQAVDAGEDHPVHDQRPLRARRLVADRLAQAMEAVAKSRHGGYANYSRCPVRTADAVDRARGGRG